MEGVEHEEENLGIGNTIRPARLKIGGKGKKSGEQNKMSRKGEKDQKKIVGMEKKDEERKEKRKGIGGRKGGIERVRVKLADVITRIEMSEEL